MSFINKTVLVTGSSSGIGAATVIGFAKEGADVVLVGRNQVKLNKVRNKCESFGSKTLVVKSDVTNDDDIKRIIEETINKFGKLDVLVNNVGSFVLTDFKSENFMSLYDAVMNLNLRSSVFITHLATSHLIKTKGNVLFISSIGAKRCVGNADSISYSTSKDALTRFAKCAALKLSENGVRVNVISPGPVRTDALENLPHVSWEQLADITAFKRVSEPTEIADLILFLASEKARGITGADFIIDNGYLVKR
ncbi:3-oxoacyl-[acyl-carrier-protein] reductase FabG-like [Battus philenor]|uniref:3-oxoacyl-[acyl-carrier-protein] reductase FabG-like n=1 Tax=Battus philenor TaxID=42288 RepID=UPI0035D0EB4E